SAAAGIEGNFSNSSFATAAADFDNDGWCDLYIGNSNTTHILYKNNGNGTFTNISGSAGIIESNHQAVAVADFNNDGWMDVFSAGGPQNRLMINDGGTNHWLKITTRGTQSSYNAVGARLSMYINGSLQIREIRAGDSFCSQNDLMTAHFGLGTATEADSLIIEWPVGTIDKLYNVLADRHIEIREGIGEVTPLQQVSLGFPADGDTIRAISSATLRWDLVGGNGLLGTEMGTSFNLRMKGAGLDTVFSGISDTSFALDLSLLNSGSDYEWMIEATDGFSVLASRELNSFRFEQAAFASVTPGDIGSDQRFSEGGSWADYDGDGDLDLFVTNIVNQDNLLYRNEGNGDFTSVTGIAPVNDGGFSYGSHWVDYDNDGDVDLFVVNGGNSQNAVNFLYRNDNGTFTRVSDGAIATDADGSWSAAWADYDLDGDLDLFVANYNQPNALYENTGSGGFVRLSSSGVEGNNTPSLGCSWADYNSDGYPDLFVANANFGAGALNNLYTNNGDGTFTEVSTGGFASDVNNSVAGSCGDLDNDGDLDLYITNYFNENNTLYINNGDGTFSTASGIAPVQDGGLSVGSAWGDFDNDGDLDLAVSDDEASGLNRLYLGDGQGGFTAVTGEPVVTDIARTNSMTWADYDGDGDLDLFAANGDQAPNELSNFLYRNNQNNGNNWITLRLSGLLSNSQAVGSKVYVRSRIDGENRWQMQEVSTQTGYNSQNSLDVEFGLASATRVDSIRIEWASGIVQRLAAIDVNQLLEIEEDLTLSVDPIADAIVPDQIELAQNYPNPFNPETLIRFSLPQAELVTLEVYNLLGQRVSLLVDQQITAGVHEVKWRAVDDNGKSVQSGIYFYRLKAGEQVITKKMTLIK
ncbi:MAG: FG-GAP-like repeat-containing protein, partial [Calditrichota bacterium]